MKWFFVVIESRGVEFRGNEKGSPNMIILGLPLYLLRLGINSDYSAFKKLIIGLILLASRFNVSIS